MKMHQSSDFQVLAACEHGYIGECTCCRGFNFGYKNILLCFQEEEMIRFLDWLQEGRFRPEHYMPLPHQRDRVYSSPISNLYLSFDLTELEEIERLFTEVQLVLEARRIVSGDIR